MATSHKLDANFRLVSVNILYYGQYSGTKRLHWVQDLWLDISVEFVVLGLWTNIAHEILRNVVYEQEEFDYLPTYNNLWLSNYHLNNLGCPYNNWVEISG